MLIFKDDEEWNRWIDELKRTLPNFQGYCRYYFQGRESRFESWYDLILHSDDSTWLQDTLDIERRKQIDKTERYTESSEILRSLARIELCELLLNRINRE